MNWLKENWFKIGLLAILVISVAGVFYWYSWRPNQIRKNCYEEARTAETKINALGGYIPFHIKTNAEEVKNCYEETKMKISNCYENDQDTTQEEKDCHIKAEAGTYDTCYKKCLREKGL